MTTATRQKQYHFHYDAGHGWLKVEVAELHQLGIASKISACSYRRGAWAYLEEDCDAGLFINAVGLQLNQIINHDDGDDSPIRGLEQYRA